MSIRKPIDIACRPWPSIGSSALPSFDSRLPGDAEHHRLRRAVDVGIEHADRRAFGRQRQREVDRGRAFAHPAFARSDRDDVAYAGDQLHAALHGVRDDFHRHVDADAADVRERLQLRGDLPADRLDLALGGIAEHDVERDVVAFDLDVAGGLGGDVVLAGVRIGQLFQCVKHLLLGDCHGGSSVRREF